MSDAAAAVIGIDVGGTKLAAGLVDVTTGGACAGTCAFRRRRSAARRPILADCVALAEQLAAVEPVAAIGLGLCEFVDRQGRPDSAQTIDWRGRRRAGRVRSTSPRSSWSPTCARAALAEVRFGAGAGHPRGALRDASGRASRARSCSTASRTPGAHGHAISLGAPVVEDVAAWPALAAAGRAGRARRTSSTIRPCRGRRRGRRALGRELAALVNALDPAIVIVGGGLGRNDAYRERIARAARALLFSARVATVPIVPARLGTDAGIVGAALAAVTERSRCDGRSIR